MDILPIKDGKNFELIIIHALDMFSLILAQVFTLVKYSVEQHNIPIELIFLNIFLIKWGKFSVY